MTLVCVITAAAVFALDLLRPVGANYEILYLGVILVAAAFVERRTTAVLAALCSLLVVVGLIGSTEGVRSSYAIANRAFTILLVWFIALFFGRVRDIARRTLRVAESAPIAVVLAGGDGGIVYVNPATERLFGYAHGELEGHPVENLIPERFRGSHGRAFTTFGGDGRSAAFLKNPALTGLRKDGSEFPLEMQLTALATEGDSLVLCYITDVTDRRQFDSVAEQLMMIRDSSDDAIIGTTIGGIITSWNQAAEQLYGYAAAEAIGRDAAELTVPPARASEIVAIAEQLASTGRVRRFETERMRQDGSLVGVSISMALVRDDEGRSVGTLALTHDISDRKRAEAALRAAHDELETRVMERTASLTAANVRLEQEIAERHKAQANLRRSERLAAIGTLSAGIAHEINNPLGLIAFELEHARRHGTDPAALAASLAEIEKAVARCANIVSGVLGFARHEATHLAYGDVNEAIQKAIEATCESGRRAGVTVRSELRGNLPPLLMNPVDMEQVLVNLIENALHASVEGGEVLVMSDGSANLLRVRVRDQGRGMSDAEAARACEPFYTTRMNEGGTGLGLSICHGIVASHGGVLSIESAPGVGTTITLEFPVEQDA
jgi:PAS domain S-box-containing protein